MERAQNGTIEEWTGFCLGKGHGKGLVRIRLGQVRQGVLVFPHQQSEASWPMLCMELCHGFCMVDCPFFSRSVFIVMPSSLFRGDGRSLQPTSASTGRVWE